MPYCNDSTNFIDKTTTSEKTSNQNITNPSGNRVNRKNVSLKKTHFKETDAVSENKENI